LPTRNVTKLSLAEMMVGRKLAVVTDNRVPVGDDVSVDVQGLTVQDSTGTARVADLSFDIRKGEILGIAGVSGNGQTELLSCLAGQTPPTSGKIRLGSLEWTAERPATTRQIRAAGIAQVPEDRLRHGLIGRWPARDNSVLGLQHSGKVPGMGRV